MAINSRFWPGSRAETCQISQGECEIHALFFSAPLAAFAAASLLFAQGATSWCAGDHRPADPPHMACGLWSYAGQLQNHTGEKMMRNLPRVQSDPLWRDSGHALSSGQEHDGGDRRFKRSEDTVTEGHHLWGHYVCGSCLHIYSHLYLCLCLRKANITSMGEAGGRVECRQARTMI